VDYTTDNPIANVSRRLFAYANAATGYNMTLDGQEDLMSIQYFGEGTDNPAPDRYTPHCDGTCDGTLHKKGGRVATMVMYCDVPELGGSTNFQHSNVHVKPKLGAAAFFSYLDTKTRHHELGFTTHSGCPVLLGTKRIAVQWMRIGVDLDNPWDSFDTNTNSKLNVDDDDDEEDEYEDEEYDDEDDLEDDYEVA
jgi:2OG-Fe(II) oxygenase superfamily